MISFSKRTRIVLLCLAGGTCGAVLYFQAPRIYSNIEYINSDEIPLETTQSASSATPLVEEEHPPVPVVKHIPTPEKVKAVYLSSWVAGSAKYREPIIDMIDKTEINAIVIDVKDSTGRISFPVSDPNLASFGSVERRIGDIDGLVARLHEKDIYLIARVAVFQDPFLTHKKPEWSVRKKSDGGVWKDRKGLSFLDPTQKEVWDYAVAIGHEAYNRGFDEINFDYIRYPSDGNMNDINYNLAPGKTRADNIEAFFIYLAQEMKKNEPIPISADLFGLTTEISDDMGIGQVWEKAIVHFDFVSPMVYPSHYPAGYAGLKNPAAHPYEVITRSLKSAIEKTKVVGEDTDKIRPWLQDFDMGAIYTKDLVRAQIKATHDLGLDSWMLWDPANKYTPSAFLLENTQ